ncbi:MAG: Flp pilus assembly protein CpaB [Chloroflexi bacterium]|nr:MAG: Flp pilus assembly protein CpaB [Chloroflexota bacterium]
MRRIVYLSAFVLLSGIAGILYYSHTQQSIAVVATRDLPVGARIQDADLTTRRINPASVGPQVLTTVSAAVGQVVAFPILEGQLIDARQVAPSKNAALLGSGLQVPPGDRIIGLPITPTTAVGGVLKPGDLVDVIAIPNPAKAPTLVDELPATPIRLGHDVLVLGLRTDQGSQVDQTDHGLNAGNSKPASVLLAIPQSEETTYAAASADSTFVLTLSTD